MALSACPLLVRRKDGRPLEKDRDHRRPQPRREKVFTFTSDDTDFIGCHLGRSVSAFYADGWDLQRGGCYSGCFDQGDTVLSETISILACPACRGALTQRGERLVCGRCRTGYRIEGSIPVLLVEEGTPEAEPPEGE
ncbi:MAG TPA: Trm112 family protein [Verrucomicrobiae bacterium]|nr:Trm112 family protein [Verrucomicrobiae bacterium]